MKKSNADEPRLVGAAQRGDQRARDALVRKYLPLVYNIVGRSLHRYDDIDVVVQEIMLRMVRDLPAVPDPEAFRSWVSMIAVRRVSAYLRHAAEAAQLTAAPDGITEPTVDFEEAAVLHLRLSGQRREVAEASRWLDQEDRVALSVWWLDAAGEMTHEEVTAALETTIACAAARIQRMRSQLDLSRSVVAALAASPCRQLGLTAAEWDSRPSALWRKRIFRHVRDCPVCLASSRERISAERLLAGCGLVPVPALLAAKVIAMTAAEAMTAAQIAEAARATRGRWLSRAVSRHPAVTATTVAVAVIALATACSATVPAGPLRQAARPAAAAHSVRTGVALVSPVIVRMTHSPRARRHPHHRGKPARSPAPVASHSHSPAPVASHSHSPAPVASHSHSPAPVASHSPAPVAPPSPSLAPVAPHAGCGSRYSDIWANWPMPNSPGSGLPNQESYTNLGNGTVRDNVTCLVWQRAPAPGTYTFAQAKAYCAGLTVAGGGWQLPARIQLMSIVDPAQAGPAIDTAAFPGTPSAFFWTSSPWFVTASPVRAWIINFYEGMESNAAWETGTYQVRCVQSADGTGVPGYQVAGGQVTDPATGLTWQQGFSATQVTAAAAGSYCAGLDLGGYSWRLPSVKELATLVDEDRVSPAIDVSAFPGVGTDVWFWSSTVSASSPPQQWGLNYNDGFSYFRSTSDTGYARCVR